MSRDIRSFFTVSKKSGSKNVKTTEKPISVVVDSDDDVIDTTPVKTNIKASVKRKVQVISSDSEDDSSKNKSVVPKINKKGETNLKPVNIDDIFGNKTIKQTKVDVSLVKESPKPQNKSKKASKSKPKTELGVHNDEDFEKTLLDLDDSILIDNLEEFDKSIHENLRKKEHGGQEQGSSKENSPKKKEDAVTTDPKVEYNSNDKSVTENESKRKRVASHSDADDTPKKGRFIHTDSGVDADQEIFEKRRYSAMLYQKYKNRGGPKNQGKKELPQGKPHCLKNLVFLRTGVLDSLDSDDFKNLVEEHGGRVVHSVSKKVNYVVIGDEPGPSKLEKARGYKIPEIDEDDLLDMILVKSGQKPKFVKNKSAESNESGIITDEDIARKETVNKVKQKTELKVKEEKISPQNHKSVKKKHSESHPKELNESQIKPTSKPTLKNLSDVCKPEKTDSVTESLENNKPTIKKQIVNTSDSDDYGKKHSMSSSLPPFERKPLVVSLADKSWTEKYKPSSMKAIIGQQDPNSNMNKLKKWLEKWHTNQLPDVKKRIQRPSPWAKNDDGAYFKAALLSGPPGVGKTTTATLVCRELGLDIVEFNASDTRSKRLLHEEVSQLLSTKTIAGFAAGDKTTNTKRVLLMDEVDGMAGNEDRGGMQELINLIKSSSIPIICMCNDRNHQKMRSLVNYCFDLKFGKPKLEQIRGAMMSICFKEGVQLTPNTLTEIINGAGCDIRQTLNNLAMWTAGEKNLSLETAQKEAKSAVKDTVLGPWEVVKLVFTESEQKKMTFADKSRLFFYDYSINPLFVQENYLNVTPNCPSKLAIKQAALAADAISTGDIIDAKIRGSNNWSLLESQAVFASVLPGHYMSGHISKRINFPSWLGKNSAASKRKRILSEIHIHTRTSTSGSRMAMLLDYVVPLKNSIIDPLKRYGVDGVHRSLEVMKSYNLLREDLNNMIELCQYKGSKNPFDEIDAKVKSAFTRVYNKEGPLLPFAPVAGVSKKKIAYSQSDLIEENDDIESDEETDDLKHDTMIKIKTKTEPKGKKNSSNHSSSSTKTSKGKGGRKKK